MVRAGTQEDSGIPAQVSGNQEGLGDHIGGCTTVVVWWGAVQGLGLVWKDDLKVRVRALDFFQQVKRLWVLNAEGRVWRQRARREDSEETRQSKWWR